MSTAVRNFILVLATIVVAAIVLIAITLAHKEQRLTPKPNTATVAEALEAFGLK